MKLSVVTRIVAGFAILLLMLAAIATMARLNVRQLQAQLNITVQELAPMAEQANQLSGLLLDSARQVSIHSVANAAEQRRFREQQVEVAAQGFRERLSALQSLASNYPQVTEQLQQLEAPIQHLQATAEHQLALREQAVLAESQQAQLRSEFNKRWVSLIDELGFLFDMVDETDEWLITGIENDARSLLALAEKLFVMHDPAQFANQMPVLEGYRGSLEQKYQQLQQSDADTASELSASFELLATSFSAQGSFGLLATQQQLQHQQQTQLELLNQQTDQALVQLEQLSQAINGIITQASLDARESANRATWRTVSVAAFALLLSVVVIASIVGSIRKPLKSTLTAIQRMAKGDFSQTPQATSQDEFGQIARNLSELNLQVSKIISNVNHQANSLAQSAQQGMTTSQHTHQLLSNQQQQSLQVSDAVDIMEQGVSEVVHQAIESEQSIEQLDQLTRQGQDAAKVTLQSSQELQQAMDDASAQVQQVKEQSLGINAIVDMIRGLSEQTNLLALNAAIEAARAGEQGRGFAVVADEVRTLAASSQASTDDILEVVEGLQKGAQSAMDLMQQGETLVQSCMVSAQQSEAQLLEVAKLLASVRSHSVDIAANAKEKHQVAVDVSKHVKTIVELGEQAGLDANRNLDVSESLQRQSQEQLEALAGFKL